MSGNGFGRLAAAGLVLLAAAGLGAPRGEARQGKAEDPVEQGRYLVRIAGCNDCHTAGYSDAGGEVPEAQWLLGTRVGWQGPWGTTYAGNLRLALKDMAMADWMKLAGEKKLRPPMPWPSLHAMKKRDLKAIYAYIRSLGAAGDQAPAFVPPGGKAGGPVVVFPAPPKK